MTISSSTYTVVLGFFMKIFFCKSQIIVLQNLSNKLKQTLPAYMPYLFSRMLSEETQVFFLVLIDPKLSPFTLVKDRNYIS